MAQLRAALDAAGAGRGSMVLLTGAAGIGKSRLVGELVADAEPKGLLTALGRATLASADTPSPSRGRGQGATPVPAAPAPARPVRR